MIRRKNYLYAYKQDNKMLIYNNDKYDRRKRIKSRI